MQILQNEVVTLVIINSLVVGVLVALVVRASIVSNYRDKVLLKIHDLNVADLKTYGPLVFVKQLNDKRFADFEKVSFLQMVFNFKPLNTFYKDFDFNIVE